MPDFTLYHIYSQQMVIPIPVLSPMDHRPAHICDRCRYWFFKDYWCKCKVTRESMSCEHLRLEACEEYPELFRYCIKCTRTIGLVMQRLADTRQPEQIGKI